MPSNSRRFRHRSLQEQQRDVLIIFLAANALVCLVLGGLIVYGLAS